MAFDYLNRVVFAVGRAGPTEVTLLGTATLLPHTGKFATVAHVTGTNDKNLVIVVKEYDSINDYQDTSNKKVQMVAAHIEAIDPVIDLCVLSTNSTASSNISLGSVDDVTVGDSVDIFGYPHADQGRLVLTHQRTHVGARILVESQGVRTKHIVLNVQARPGQSGGPIFSGSPPEAVAFLVGSYAAGGGGGISLGGIDPQTLHQTTHAVSAEYLTEMLT